MVYRFGDFELHEDGFCLTRDGQRISLEPKALNVLLVLVSRPGRLVEKRALMELVWNGTFVEENTLTRIIGVLRRELGDSTKDSRFIETIPTRGYRFITPVETLPESAPLPLQAERPAAPATSSDLPPTLPQSPPPSPSTSPSRPRRRTLVLAAIAAVILAASGFTVWYLHSKPASEEVSTSSPVPLTTYRGNEDAPSLSPDGNQVAFEWNGEKQDKFNIYVMLVSPGSTPLRLTNDPNPSRWPSWSPDGQTIAFVRTVNPGILDLMLIPALGGPERKLAEIHYGNDPQGFFPVWTPNSKWLVIPAVIGSTPHLIRISIETGESNPITDAPTSLVDTYPAISPDGRTLIFDRHGAFTNGILYTMPIDADANPIGAPTQVLQGARYWQARWTADGKEIIAHGIGQGFYGAVRVPADGAASPKRVPFMVSSGLFDIARRGHRFVFASIHGDINIWRIDLTARPFHPEPFIASTMRDFFPQYSPDGRKLAFFSDRSGTGLQIWASDSDGNQTRQLTFTQPGNAESPHWSPDSQTLTFDTSTNGHLQVYTMSADGGKWVQRTHGAYDNFDSTWSRDGRWLYFTSNQSGRNELWKVSADGDDPVQVTRNGGRMATESPDGNTLYFSKGIDNNSIWKMPTAGGPEQEITSYIFRTNFAVTKTGIYFMTASGIKGTSEARFYSFATGAITTVTPIGLPENGFAISPDGRYLLYAQLDDPASDLMLVENFH